MPQRFGHLLMQQTFGLEIIYSFVIIICSLMIYFGTKELYELSNHRGIKYFRQAFLFFAIAYFFRSFIKFVLSYFDVRAILDISTMVFSPILAQATLFIFIYFSSMAVFYLLYSVMWKKLNNGSDKIIFFHLTALVIALIIILSANQFIYLWLNIILFLVLAIIFFVAHKNKRKRSKKYDLYVIYLLLLIFWVLNILDILIPDVLQTFQLVIYIFSLGIFLSILYKVLKKVGSN